MSSYDDDDFMSGGAKTVPFDNIGDSVTGIVLSRPQKTVQRGDKGQPKTFDDGSPRFMYALEIQTELRDPQDSFDDGKRTLYLKWHSHDAAKNAVRSSGARGIEPGGIFTLTLTGFGQKKNPAHNAPKLYSAAYIPPDPNVEFMASAPTAPPAPTAQAVTPTAPAQVDQAAVIARLRAQQQGALTSQPPHHATGEAPF